MTSALEDRGGDAHHEMQRELWAQARTHLLSRQLGWAGLRVAPAASRAPEWPTGASWEGRDELDPALLWGLTGKMVRKMGLEQMGYLL